MSNDRDVAAAFAGFGPAPIPPSPIRVVLADDHALMRRRLRQVIDGDDHMMVIAEADDLSAVKHHVHGLLPHVLVIDLSMSNGSSIEAIRSLRRHEPRTEIVVVTMEDSPVFAQQALDAGAIGFIVKHAAVAELAAGVLSAARGVEYVSPRVAARPASRRKASA